MPQLKNAALLVAVVSAFAVEAKSNEYEPAMEAYFDSEISKWANDGQIVDAILSQNETSADYDSAKIDQLDKAWRAEVGSDDTPTVTPVLTHPASDYLRTIVEASGGAITEVFVMDAKGLNVAASDATSDMWQGDEAKFIESYGRGADSVHYSEIEFDDSSQRYQGQISVTVSDPTSGAPIGAITVGVDAEALI